MSNISDDGNIAAYMSVIPSDNSLGGAVAAVAVARRGANGWTSTAADPAAVGGIYNQTGTNSPKVFSSDFTRVLMKTNLSADPADTNEGGFDVYRLDVGRGKGKLLSPMSVGFDGAYGATSDLGHVVFQSLNGSLYRSDGTNLDLLSVYPDGQALVPTSAEMAGGAFRRGIGVGEFREVAPWVERGGDHAVSDDAKRVYFINAFAGSQLYVRDLAVTPARTVAVTRSSRAGDPPNTVFGGVFISASHNGSTAYFASNEQLTDTATPGGGIYRFDLASESVTQLTPDAGDPTGLHLEGAISSDDQSHIYFTSRSALAAGAVAGDTNAYVWTSGGVRFIAKVGSGDKFARVTLDGRYALMMSPTSIGGAPNNGFMAIYGYDALNDRLTCVSCRQDGSPSNGAADIDAQSLYLPGGPMTHNRALTFEGGVVFTSTDRLVREDQTSAQDVYFWQNGALSLLTAGMGDDDAFVGEVSDDGKNIFVYARSAFVPADRDPGEFDLYDIRVNGGFLHPPAPSPPCRPEDCQPAAPRPPDKYVPTSSETGPSKNASPDAIRKKLSMSRLTATQRAALARTGRVSVSVRVIGGGTVTVRGRGRLNGKAATFGRVSESVLKTSATTVKVTFKLSTASKTQLLRDKRLKFTLEGRLSGVSRAVTSTVNLSRAKR